MIRVPMTGDDVIFTGATRGPLVMRLVTGLAALFVISLSLARKMQLARTMGDMRLMRNEFSHTQAQEKSNLAHGRARNKNARKP